LNLLMAKSIGYVIALLFAAAGNLGISHSVTAVTILKQRLWKRFIINKGRSIVIC
jgi:hypothetical protein